MCSSRKYIHTHHKELGNSKEEGDFESLTGISGDGGSTLRGYGYFPEQQNRKNKCEIIIFIMSASSYAG